MTKPIIPKHLLEHARRLKQKREEKFAHAIKIEWHRSLTWKERFKILLGANFLVHFIVCTRKRNEVFHPIVIGNVTEHLTATDVMNERALKAASEHLTSTAAEEFARSK